MQLPADPVVEWEDITLNFEAIQALFHALPLTAASWAAPTLVNSWTTSSGGGGAAGYLKDPFGFVHLRGSLATGTTGTTAFTLPAGFRVGVTDFWPALQSSGAAGAFLRVGSDGTIQPTYTGATVYLNGITFLAEN